VPPFVLLVSHNHSPAQPRKAYCSRALREAAGLFPRVRPRSDTRGGLTRAFKIGPVSSQAAPTRPPQTPEQRMRRRTWPTVLSRP
jgi:hypothetical protein